MSRNPLDLSALTTILPTLLPPSSKSLNSPQDALAALLHTAMVAVGYRLIGVDNSLVSRQDLRNVLPEEWSQKGPGYYTFRYKHEQSSLEFVVTVSMLGNDRIVVNAVALESDKATSFDISTQDLFLSSFPCDLSASDTTTLSIFPDKLTNYISQIKVKVIQKLTPGLHKEGYVEQSENNTTAQARSEDPEPSRPRQVTPPYAPDIPDRFPYNSHIPPENPLSIGRRDLEPFPQNPFAPPMLFPHRGDGMFVGPDHPMFDGRARGVDGRGRWGGDGFLPPMGAPPGARFDPVGPFPGRGGRRGPPGGGGLHGPDNDEFMPPGIGDMYM